MRTSRAFVVLTVAGSIDGTLRKGLSLSLQLPAATRRGSFQREQSPGSINRICQRIISTGTTCGGTTRRRCRSSSSNSSGSSALSSTVGLPSLDGLPGAVSSASSPGARSRRGKYPVVELWRRETEHDFSELGEDDGDREDEDDVDDLAGGRAVAGSAARGSPRTALEHLRVALALGSEQVDAVRESFPALDEVDPEKLDLRPKLVSNAYSWKYVAVLLILILQVPRTYEYVQQ